MQTNPLFIFMLLASFLIAHLSRADDVRKKFNKPDSNIAYCYEALRADITDVSKYCGGAILKANSSSEINLSIKNRSILLASLESIVDKYNKNYIRNITNNDEEIVKISKQVIRDSPRTEYFAYCFSDISYFSNKYSPYCSYVESFIKIAKYSYQIEYRKESTPSEIISVIEYVLYRKKR